MAEQKLNIRQTRDSMLFYIDGGLQFSSEDEHIYHEMMVHPGAAIANNRLSPSWRALILGGGDGLALREILKYRKCSAVDLADFDAEVVEHAKTTFSKLNQQAFDDQRVSIFIEDAYEYLKRSNDLYDLIISDFTFPNTPETAKLFTSDFFIRIRERLSENGIFSMNAVSPTQHDKAYQAIFNTLTELDMNPLSLKFSIPSFVNHGYGTWGFFFGSPTMITSQELNRWKTCVKTRFIQKEQLLKSLSSLIHSDKIIRTPSDLLNLLGIPIPLNISPMQIDREWIVRLLNILRSMDIERLFDEVSFRIQGLSESLQEQFRYLRRELPNLLKDQVVNMERAGQCLSVLMLIIVSVNLLYPDNIYAKGYSSGGSGSGFSFVAQDRPTPFHSKALQAATLAYAVNMSGKTYAKKSVMVENDKSEELPGGNLTTEELFYAVTDDIFLTPSGRAYLTPKRFAPYYYRIKPDSFSLIRETDATPLVSMMPDNETVYLLISNTSVQIRAVEKTISDYEKWSAWTSPLQYISESIQKESVEIGNLKKIRDALKAAFARFVRYLPVKLPETNPRKVAPGLYQDNEGKTLLWLAGNQWQIEIPDNIKEFVNKALSSEPKIPQPIQNKLLQMQQMLEKQLIDMNK